MKRIFIVCSAASLFLAACGESGSSTIGTYDTTQTAEPADNEGPEAGKDKMEKPDTMKLNTSDTATTPVDSAL